ncbi:MAG: hypothetical protein GXP55_20925 [Deltaproteobacteria bacterium]|nr:hypothetical protein [Deltaproteobacteria bacterium]
MLRASCISAALSALLLITACSKSSTATPPLDQVPARFANDICDRFESCVGPLVDLFLSGADCRQTFTQSAEDNLLPLWQAAVTDGSLIYDGAQLDACLTALTGSSCGSLNQRDLAPCDQVFQGQIPVGGSCNVEAQCQGARYCDSSSTCPGTCTDRKDEGAACTDDAECISGLTCDGDPGTCQRPRNAGESCGGGSLPGCGLPTVCMGDDAEAGTPGTCRSLSDALTAAVGESCDPGAGTLCVEGASCALVSYDPATMDLTWTCVAAYAAGADCSLAVPDACPSGQVCSANPAGGTFSGSCTPLPTASEACRTGSGGPQCAPGLVCDGGSCAVIGRLGEGCVTDKGCASGKCTGNLCVAPVCG